MARTCSRSVTSTPTDVAVPPSATIPSTTRCAAAESRSATTTFAPSAAIARHAAAPIPPAPPVTITTRSCTRPISRTPSVSDGRLFAEEVGAADVGFAADEEVFGGEFGDDAVAFWGDDDFFFDACGGVAVAGCAVGFECEDHAGFDGDGVLEGVDAADHGRFVEADAEAVAELQAEAGV